MKHVTSFGPEFQGPTNYNNFDQQIRTTWVDDWLDLRLSELSLSSTRTMNLESHRVNSWKMYAEFFLQRTQSQSRKSSRLVVCCARISSAAASLIISKSTFACCPLPGQKRDAWQSVLSSKPSEPPKNDVGKTRTTVLHTSKMQRHGGQIHWISLHPCVSHRSTVVILMSPLHAKAYRQLS